MRRLAMALLSGAFLAGALPAAAALAQTAPAPAPVQTPSGPVQTAPRNPTTASTGLAGDNQQRATSTVQQIDHKLLSDEKDRPSLPGQAPSPSKGGSAMGATATTPH